MDSQESDNTRFVDGYYFWSFSLQGSQRRMVPGYNHRMVRPRTEYGPFFQTNSVNISRAGNLAGIKAHPFRPGLFFYMSVKYASAHTVGSSSPARTYIISSKNRSSKQEFLAFSRKDIKDICYLPHLPVFAGVRITEREGKSSKGGMEKAHGWWV